jgi:hypothetical protein
MILDYHLIEALAMEFLRKRGENYITGTLLPGDEDVHLGDENHKFATLYVESLHADVTTSSGSSADRVDGFHADSTPRAGYLLALDSNARFPTAALGPVLFTTGGTMTGNLNMAAGALVDGVDLNVFYADYLNHIATGGSVGVHSHLNNSEGGDLVRFAHADGRGSRAAHAAQRLLKHLNTGNGLLGGGLFDRDLNVSVNAGAGLGFMGGALVLNTPGTLSAVTANNAEGAHVHEVAASNAPTGESLLKSTSSGGLTLQSLNVGSGGVDSSGDIQGQRILSDQNAFVGGDLIVGSDVLVTNLVEGSVRVNGQLGVPGALTVQSAGPTQRGVVVQGAADQENTAPLFSARDADGHDLFLVRPDGTLASGAPAFVSGLTGWRISGEGDAEFRNITARGELHTSVFVANEMHATGGTMAVMHTGVVADPINPSDNTVTAIDTTTNLVVAGDPNLPGVCPFQENDVLRLKLMTEN